MSCMLVLQVLVATEHDYHDSYLFSLDLYLSEKNIKSPLDKVKG